MTDLIRKSAFELPISMEDILTQFEEVLHLISGTMVLISGMTRIQEGDINQVQGIRSK
jgi:hypothetical protein